MKSNHDIDKLFSQKLDSLESAPSMDSWLKLEKNLQDKRQSKKRVMWLPYAAAAAVALLMVSVWLMHGWDNKNNNTMANVSNKQMPKTQPTNQPAPAVNKAPADSGTIAQPEKEETLLAIKEKADNVAEQQVPKRTPVVAEQKKNVPTIQVNTIEEVEPKIIEVEDKIALQAPAIENKIPQQPSVVVVVQVDASEQSTVNNVIGQEVDEPDKQTRAGKLLTKLKKIKKAEFEELGIRPESIVAFVKDKTSKH